MGWRSGPDTVKSIFIVKYGSIHYGLFVALFCAQSSRTFHSGSRSGPLDYHRLGHPAAIAQWIQQAQLVQQQQQQQQHQQQHLKDEPNDDDARTQRGSRGPSDYPDI